MDQDALYRRLREQVYFEVSSYQQALDQLGSDEYPTSTAESLAKELDSQLEAIRRRLQQIEFAFVFDPDGAIEQLQTTRNRLTMVLTDYLGWLDGARTHRVPWSVVPGLERIATYLLPHREILTSCSPVPTYRIIYFPGTPSGLHKYFIVQVPSLLRLNALSHVVIAHELFHPILESFLKLKRPKVLNRMQVECNKIVKAPSRSDTLSPEQRQQRLDLLVEYARQIWEGAVKEIMCDMGCVALFGPAGFLALGDPAMAYPLDHVPHPTHYHPPWRYRLRATLKHGLMHNQPGSPLNNLYTELSKSEDTKSLVNLLKEEMKGYQSQVDITSDTDEIDNAPAVYRIAYKEVESLLDSAWTFIANKTKNCPINWTKSFDQIPELVAMLRVPAPPGELRGTNPAKPSSPCLAAIANAAWLFHLDQRRLNPDKDGNRNTLDFKTTCRLVLKGFENSHLRVEYEKMAAKSV